MEAPKIAKHLFKVVTKEYITPHYIRVHLEGEGAQDFAQCTLGANNKIFLRNNPIDRHHHTDALDWDSFFGDEAPIVRTYTHKAIDINKNIISIDFVFHGDNGPASHWAHKAAPGDTLGVAMKLKNAPLVPNVDKYLLVGDATALPVLSCILASLPNTTFGKCFLEVPSVEDIQTDIKHDGFEIEWIINPHPENGSTLSNEIKDLDASILSTFQFAYIAAEYATVKDLRWYLREEHAWDSKRFYAYSYWKAGQSENETLSDRQAEKNA